MDLRDERVVADKDLEAFGHAARVARAFADPVRLELIDALAQGARTVDSLAELCGLPLKNVSHHLKRLREANLVHRVRLGRKAVYSLADEGVALFWAALRRFARERREPAEDVDWEKLGAPVTADALSALLARRRVVVIDVRPQEEFDSGHLPGALSLPEPELDGGLDDLPRDRPVVVFCRGPNCRLADRAVARLRASGFTAVRCDDGVIEWKAGGHPLAATKTR
jgi:rhodanese-related sulfurtransferase/predicted transcriptional regulator